MQDQPSDVGLVVKYEKPIASELIPRGLYIKKYDLDEHGYTKTYLVAIIYLMDEKLERHEMQHAGRGWQRQWLARTKERLRKED